MSEVSPEGLPKPAPSMPLLGVRNPQDAWAKAQAERPMPHFAPSNNPAESDEPAHRRADRWHSYRRRPRQGAGRAPKA